MNIQDGQGLKDRAKKLAQEAMEKTANEIAKKAIEISKKQNTNAKEWVKKQSIPDEAKNIAYKFIDEMEKQSSSMVLKGESKAVSIGNKQLNKIGGDPYYLKYLKYKKLYIQLKQQQNNSL